MATETTNFGLTKDASTDYYNIDTANSNLDKIDRALGNTAKFETAGGTGTAIILTGIELEEGHSKTFVVNANNNGVATTINGKNLYKPGTTQAPKLIAGKAVTVWYNGTHFFIKASAEGDAIAENVLAEKTFSNDDDTGIAGTMVNNGPVSAEIIDLSTEGAEYTIPKGFHSGLRKIRAKISGLVASVIKSGTKVGGITGTFTSDANAVAGDIVKDKVAYVKGEKVVGTMPDRGAVNHELPINGSFTIPAGRHSGSGKVTQDIPTKGAETITPGTKNRTIEGGQYLTGNQIILGDPDLIPANILKGKNIFGVEGIVEAGKKFVTGTAMSNSSYEPYTVFAGGTAISCYSLIVSGLTFKPSVIMILASNSYGQHFYTGYLSEMEIAFTGTFKTAGTGPSSGAIIKADQSPAYVNESGFKLPIHSANVLSCIWWAYE